VTNRRRLLKIKAKAQDVYTAAVWIV